MWRLCKLGYRHEPRLMLVSFVLSQLAALPDALLALWLMLLGKGVLDTRTWLGARSGDRSGRFGCRHMVSPHRQHARAAPLPRQGDDRAGIPRGATAGHGGHDRASGTAGISRPACRCCATRCSCWTTCTCRCSPRWAGFCGWRVTMALLMSIHPALILLDCVCGAHGVDFDLAAGDGEIGAGARRTGRPAGAASVYDLRLRRRPGKEVRVTGIGEMLVAGPACGVGAMV